MTYAASSYPQRLALDSTKQNKKKQGVGLVVPFDFALDDECWRWVPDGVSLYITRTPKIENTAVTIDLAKEVSEVTAVQTAVKSLLFAAPGSVGYACTSGSFVEGISGEAKLQAAMCDAGARAAVTTSGALVQALRRVGAKRVAVATPYNLSLTKLLASYLEEAGFSVVTNGYLDKEEGIMHVSYEAVHSLAKQVRHDEADAVFFSCTNLRTFDVIEELEAELGVPVLSANQVTMWSALELAGVPLPMLEQRLFKATPPETAIELEAIPVPV